MSLLKFCSFFTNFFEAEDQGQSIPNYSYNFFSLEAYFLTYKSIWEGENIN